MQEQKDWDEHTWNTIDLGSFGQHFKRLTPSEQTSLMKLVHDQLPKGKRQYQVSQSKEAALKECPCCADADEDPTHLLRCQANAFMVPGLTALRRSSAGRSHPFRCILVDGINNWIVSGKSSFRMALDDYPVHMRETIERILCEQERILVGWDNALMGFLRKSWMDLASMRYEDVQMDKVEGTQCIRSSIKALHKYTTGIWKARNSALHDSENESHLSLRSTMHDTIVNFHQNPEHLCFDDRYACMMPLESILKSSAATQRQWIKRMPDSRAMHTRLGERQTTLITSYFRADKEIVHDDPLVLHGATMEEEKSVNEISRGG